MDKELPSRLAAAITAGHFDSANQMIASYGQAIRAEVDAAATQAEREAILQQALAFLRDRLHLARVVRSHLAAQLKTTTGVAQYGASDPASNSWRFDG